MFFPLISSTPRVRFIRSLLVVPLAGFLFGALPLLAQEKVDQATIERIKTEEATHSQIMEIMSWLSDVYGPRLTWSPNATKAGDWAMAEMKKWGLANVHEERWDTPAGLGWENERFSLVATAPVPFIVEAVPQAWSAGTNGPLTGRAMMVPAGCSDELRESYAGKLKGVFIMLTRPAARPVNAFTPTASRYSDSALAAMAAAKPAPAGGGGFPRAGGPQPALSAICERQIARDSTAAAALAAANGTPPRPRFGPRGGVSLADSATMRWLAAQGVAAILLADASHVGGDIGTNNGASRVKGAARIPTVHVAQGVRPGKYTVREFDFRQKPRPPLILPLHPPFS